MNCPPPPATVPRCYLDAARRLETVAAADRALRKREFTDERDPGASSAASLKHQGKTGPLGIVGLDQGVLLRFFLAACGIHRQSNFSLASRRDCLVKPGNFHTSAGGDLDDFQHCPSGILDLEIVGDELLHPGGLGDPEERL